jgi:hypothetical protein
MLLRLPSSRVLMCCVHSISILRPWILPGEANQSVQLSAQLLHHFFLLTDHMVKGQKIWKGREMVVKGKPGVCCCMSESEQFWHCTTASPPFSGKERWKEQGMGCQWCKESLALPGSHNNSSWPTTHFWLTIHTSGKLWCCCCISESEWFQHCFTMQWCKTSFLWCAHLFPAWRVGPIETQGAILEP